MKKNEFIESSMALAQLAQKKSYSPYSNYPVAAVIKAKGISELFFGVNVENCSYGATICAERVAVFKAVSDIGKIEIEKVLVLTNNKNPASPCGMCLQVLSEFANEKTEVFLANPKGVKKNIKFNKLFPSQYSAAALNEVSKK